MSPFPSLCAICMLLTPSPGGDRPASAWETFRPPGGRCSVQAPGVMRHRTGLPKATKAGTPITLFVLQQQYHYLLGYTDYPANALKQLPPEKRLDQARDEAMKLSRGKLLGEKKFTHGANPGREVKVEMENRAFARLRFILAKDRLYFVAVIGSKGVLEARPAVKFLDSFEVLK
jgi:hypothetical protein